ncbi:MAG: glycoside hydrolase family 2 TIM barrel-domain containing protein [Bacteroidales bacterium]|nr:glycoside hydrolase family 2 TIM barrel-domain containing protein [Bacteroidales bacterium]MDY6406888.1 glycoside hydrolase family 2 TIM barrel-domain containing protein [Bacteroidales bacterium]
MRKSIYTMLLISSMVFYACTSKQPVRTDTLLREWQFTQDTTENPQWENVTIPHDWAISGPFDRANDLQEVIVVQNGEKEPTWKTGRSGGLPWMGKGHYKTRVAVKKDKFYTLVFDGAMSHADVYVNGEEVVYWPYGYNTFDCYILPGLITGDSVDIDVFLENKPQQSRWYPGAGLYRNVHLVETNPIHIPTFGVLIRTPKISKEFAQVTIDVDLQDGVEPIGTQNTEYRVQTDILFKGEVVATAEGQQSVAEVLNPQLWSPESPNLYTARTRVLKGEEVVDEVETRFGIRSISYTPEGGFQLNGETRKFKGVCNHHDLGPLGAAIHKDALRHQIKMLQDMGCDAIRTSHNMPAPELVELCDEMGMMMMVEPFDVWNWGKTENDYSVEFNEWWKWDISNMVKHYRNNACVMLWSSGNEVWNQVLPDGIEIVTKLQALFHELDPTRPVTNGMDQAMYVIHNGFGAAVELPGFNYRTSRYIEGYENLPQKMILGSETASTVSSRGVYKTPAIIQPDKLYSDNQSSGYDVEYCAWSGLPEQDFQLQDDYNWTLGQFVWTGFDYLGEPSPYDTDAWPSHSSYFGIIDLASLPKDRYYLYRSQWNKKEATLHVLPHWNWEEGDLVPVFCYTSYPSAELFVNGKSYGKLRFATKEESERLAKGEIIEGVSRMPEVGEFEVPEWGSAPRPELLPRYRLMWFDVPYEAGEITVVAYDENGKEAARETIKTAGEPDHLEVIWANESENPEELCYMTVKVVDKDGNLCPKANNLISYEGEGFVAAANGDAACLDSFVEPKMHAFAGQCTFILKKGWKGKFVLKD